MPRWKTGGVFMRFTIRDVLWLTLVVGVWVGVSVWYGRQLSHLRLSYESANDGQNHFTQRTYDLLVAIESAGYEAIEDDDGIGLKLIPKSADR
jgi:hypothetical protein